MAGMNTDEKNRQQSGALVEMPYSARREKMKASCNDSRRIRQSSSTSGALALIASRMRGAGGRSPVLVSPGHAECSSRFSYRSVRCSSRPTGKTQGIRCSMQWQITKEHRLKTLAKIPSIAHQVHGLLLMSVGDYGQLLQNLQGSMTRKTPCTGADACTHVAHPFLFPRYEDWVRVVPKARRIAKPGTLVQIASCIQLGLPSDHHIDPKDPTHSQPRRLGFCPRNFTGQCQ